MTAAYAETPTVLAHAEATERADFDVYLPLRDKEALVRLVDEQGREGSPLYRKWLSPAEFQNRFGPTAASVAHVTDELRRDGFVVSALQGHLLHVTAGAAEVEQVFGVHINHAQFADGSTALVADREMVLPAALREEGAHIPQFITVGPMHKDSQVVGAVPLNYKSSTGQYFTADLRQAYQVPSLAAVNGKGVTIGILMSNAFQLSDIEGYFESEDVSSSFYPRMATVAVNGGAPFSTSESVETHLDIEQSSGMALGANEILYNLSDLSNSVVLFGLNLMVSDNLTDVVNMSFGEPEVALTPAFNKGINNEYIAVLQEELFLQGNSQGISFFASSGDHGANPLVGSKRITSVELPADDPYVTAVGGANLVTTFKSGSNNSAYVSENAHPDPETSGQIWGSGGGISTIFLKPSYQTLVPTQSAKFRTVPDVALHMGGCPSDAETPCGPDRSADWVAIGGGLQGVIGTSASSPDIAGIFALEVKIAGTRLGNVNPLIYKAAQTQNKGGRVSFHHAAIAGNNGVYTVKAPYDPVLGNGTAIARDMMGHPGMAASGIPGTASNP